MDETAGIHPTDLQVGIMPEYHMFDFRQPQLVQEFQIGPESMLIIEFHLIVKGMRNSGFLSFFLKLDPGFNLYVGNIKVYDFKQHGINDEVFNTSYAHNPHDDITLALASLSTDYEQNRSSGTQKRIWE